MEATTKYLRLHTAEVLAATDRGEEVVITYRGRRRAVLTPWRDKRPSASGTAQRNPAHGLWRDCAGEVDAEVRRLRRGRELP